MTTDSPETREQVASAPPLTDKIEWLLNERELAVKGIELAGPSADEIMRAAVRLHRANAYAFDLLPTILAALTPAPADPPKVDDSGLVERLRAWPATGGQGDALSSGFVGMLLNEAAERIAQLSAAPSSREVERAIVVWLRRYADGSGWVHGKTPGAAWANALNEAAEAIERGDHLQALSPPAQEEQS